MGKVTREDIEVAGQRGLKNQETEWINGSPWVRQLDLFSMFCDPDDSSVGQNLMKDGFWESWITAWFYNTITPDMNCIDIGANQGYFTFMFATLAPNGITQAYEPMPCNVDLLESTAMQEGYKNVFIYDHALSDSQGKAKLVIPGTLKGSASIDVESFGGLWGPEEIIDVRTNTLDASALGRVDLVKIDAEGAEEKIWEGMKNLRQRNPDMIIVMEFDQRRYSNTDFMHSLFDYYDVSYINTDANEYLLSRQNLLNWTDWAMLVLRRKV